MSTKIWGIVIFGVLFLLGVVFFLAILVPSAREAKLEYNNQINQITAQLKSKNYVLVPVYTNPCAKNLGMILVTLDDLATILQPSSINDKIYVYHVDSLANGDFLAFLGSQPTTYTVFIQLQNNTCVYTGSGYG